MLLDRKLPGSNRHNTGADNGSCVLPQVVYQEIKRVRKLQYNHERLYIHHPVPRYISNQHQLLTSWLRLVFT